MSYRYIKATDVIFGLRLNHGKKPSDAMLRDLSRLVSERVEQWAKGTHLRKVQTWQPSEDAYRLKFGGKRASLRCWTCQKLKPDISRSGARCGDCCVKPPQAGS